jgi:hypothetical protein
VPIPLHRHYTVDLGSLRVTVQSSSRKYLKAKWPESQDDTLMVFAKYIVQSVIYNLTLRWHLLLLSSQGTNAGFRLEKTQTN